MDKRLILALGEDLATLLEDPGMIGISAGPNRRVQFHIKPDCMREIAPLEDWRLNVPHLPSSKYLIHTVIIGSVEIIALTTEPLEMPVSLAGFGEGI